MKSFYEMLQIIEGRKYLAHYDDSKEINIGEVADYYSWEGTVKIGYSRQDDGDYFPVAWGIEGSLIKFKENEEGEVVYDEKNNPIIEREFENPGVHGENLPEPYLSGSEEVTGFKDAIGVVLSRELKEVGENNPDYDWKEFNGEMREDPDILFAHHSKITHDGKEVTLGKLDDYSPHRLPWYGNPSKIDPKEMAEAERVARQVTNANQGNENEYKWRMKIYTDARTGSVQTGTFPWFIHTHEQALEEVKKHCYHQWEKEKDYHNSNQYLGTWESGYTRICKRCGKRDYVQTGYNNYSGD